MAKYKKRSDGRYEKKFDIGYDESGKRQRITVYGKTIAEMDRKIIEIQYQYNIGCYMKSSSMALGTYAHQWLKTRTGIAPATYNGYENIIKNHLKSIERIPLQKLVKSDVVECINALEGHYDLQQRLKVTLNQILNAAIDDKLLATNFVQRIKLPAKRSIQKRRPLTDAEISAIKKCAFTLRERAFVEIAYYTGMRKGEILALNVNDVNLQRHEITVSKSIAFIKNNQPFLKAPKTESSQRIIPIPDALLATLKTYIKSLNTVYLFTKQDGTLMSQSAYIRLWKSIYNKINTQLGGTASTKATDLTMHIFRHNYATLLYYNGIDVKHAQKLLGHSNIKTTLEIYTHFISDETVKEKIYTLSM